MSASHGSRGSFGDERGGGADAVVNVNPPSRINTRMHCRCCGDSGFGGSELLAGFDLLKGKRCTGMTSGVAPSDDPKAQALYEYYSESIVSDEHVVVDGNIIMAQGQAYVEFALELARQMGLYDQEGEEYEADSNWLKNVRTS